MSLHLEIIGGHTNRKCGHDDKVHTTETAPRVLLLYAAVTSCI